MTLIQIIDTFTFYGVDVIFLAFLTAVIVQVLKTTCLKNAQKKIFTFLPFAVGTLLYAIYAVIKNLDFYFLFREYCAILEFGFSVGALATLIYVLYEQFVRKDTSLSTTEGVVATLIKGYVPSSLTFVVAREIAEAIERDVTGDGAKRAEEIISSYSESELSATDLTLLAKLIIETLAHMNK